MEINETEDSTENVLSRMENSLNALEQMSLDSINITDKCDTLGKILNC